MLEHYIGIILRHYVRIILALCFGTSCLKDFARNRKNFRGVGRKCFRPHNSQSPYRDRIGHQMERNQQIQQLAILAGGGNSTAGSLLNALLKGKASPKQMSYIESLCGGSSATALDTSAILQAFASSPSRSPKAVLTVGDCTTVCAKYVRPDSTSHLLKEENRGSVTLSFGQFRTPEARYFGRILSNGQFLKGADCTDEILSALAEWKPAVY